jgi:hypothetical protein
MDAVYVLLSLFAFVGGGFVLGDLHAIFLRPDGHVFAVREDDTIHVWRDAWAYEADTGADWTKLPPQEFDLLATYHNAHRDYAKGAIFYHSILFAGTMLILRRLRQRDSELAKDRVT